MNDKNSKPEENEENEEDGSLPNESDGFGGFGGFGNLTPPDPDSDVYSELSKASGLSKSRIDELMQSTFGVGSEDVIKRQAMMTMGFSYIQSLVQFLVFFNTRMFVEEAVEDNDEAVKDGIDRVLTSWKDMMQTKVIKRMAKTNEIYTGKLSSDKIENLEAEAFKISDEAMQIVLRYAESQLLGKKDSGMDFEDFIDDSLKS
jgi:hypothetical protein